MRVKIYRIRRSTYGSTSGPSQSVENTPLATQLHHANVARLAPSRPATMSLVLGDSSIFQAFLVVITPRQASAALRVCPCKG